MFVGAVLIFFGFATMAATLSYLADYDQQGKVLPATVGAVALVFAGLLCINFEIP